MKSKPTLIRRGNVSVKIYKGKTISAGKVYPQYSLVYQDGGQRVRRRFGNFEEAKTEGELVATRLANGDHQLTKLTSADQAVYVQAVNLLQPLDRPLNLAVAEYAEALRLLPVGVSLKEAVTDFVRRHQAIRETRTVRELVAEYLSLKEKAGRSRRHLDDLRGRLAKFASAFQMPVASITSRSLQSWLDGMTLSNRSKLNELRNATALLRFAVRRKYAPRDLLDELQAVEKPEIRPTETLIFTPDELGEMLFAVRAELKPWLAVAAFCGLRSAEILRLDWQQVNLERRFVEVKATNAKTAARRLVPLCDAAVAWLTPYAKSEGRLAYYSEENKFYSAVLSDVAKARNDAIAAAAEKNNDKKSASQLAEGKAFAWKRNGLRHSFCSYRLAVTHDAAKTALEAGNSPAMIFRHFRELVTEEDGKRWFGIVP